MSPNPPHAKTSGTLDLAVAITAHDNMRTIGRTLESVRGLADRVVVVDSGSTDGTIEACREAGAEVLEKPWAGHVEQKQFAMDQCSAHRWILLLDSDESLEPPLQTSVRDVIEQDDAAFDGWELNRKVWFLGGWLHHCYQPEWRLRLVRSGRFTVKGPSPHDRLVVNGSVARMTGDLRHDSWDGIEDLARRQVTYASVSANMTSGGGTLGHLLISPMAATLKQLFLKGAILDGRRGWIAAGMTFNSKMLKHALIAARRLEGKSSGDS